jgi:acyl transferase domain-containing protein
MDDAYHFLDQHGLMGTHQTVSYPGELLMPVTMSNSVPKTSRILLLSAADKDAIQRMQDQHTRWFDEKAAKGEMSEVVIDNLAYTLARRRSLLPYRSFALIDVHTKPQGWKLDWSPAGRALDQSQLAFVFTGQGAQWAGMGKELLRFPVYRNSLLQSEDFLKQLGSSTSIIGKRTLHRLHPSGTSLQAPDALCNTKNTSSINRPGLSQLLCTVLQIALCDLYDYLGVRPVAVAGHSSGEIAAA